MFYYKYFKWVTHAMKIAKFNVPCGVLNNPLNYKNNLNRE